jgi:uncharacterized protein (DUF1330 family)
VSSDPGHEPALASRPALLIVLGRIQDRVRFVDYTQALPPVYAQYGGSYLALAPAPNVHVQYSEQPWPASSVVLSLWPTVERLRQFWNSPEYRSVAQLRAGTGEFMVGMLPLQRPQPALSGALLELSLDPRGVANDADRVLAAGMVQTLEGVFPAASLLLRVMPCPPVPASVSLHLPSLP